jgi:PAS domain S-box-containing protein
VSREAEALLGYPVVRWLDEPSFWEEHLHPEDREWATSFHARALEQARDHAFEFRMIGAAGQVVWLRDVVRVIGDGGPVRECVGVMFNVTSRREAEEDLRRSQRQLSDPPRTWSGRARKSAVRSPARSTTSWGRR